MPCAPRCRKSPRRWSRSRRTACPSEQHARHVEPTLESIVDGDYGLTRALYLYVKKQHVGAIVGLQAFVAAFASDATAGKDGYLEDRGLIPLAASQHTRMQEVARSLPTLEASDLD